ncbi:MAG: glycosyltransferase family 2 protein [Alphaproteobacteria bacterium]|nr:glycosyltransferase family 2 protein [Alphaproteobacteria bacterium]
MIKVNKNRSNRLAGAPLISVIVPVYRAQLTLASALLSVKAQAWSEKNLEIVLSIDDAKDYRWAKTYWSNITFCYGHAPATGAGAARNRGILAASGRYLAFLDADDIWQDGYLDALYPAAKKHGLAFGKTVIHAHDGTFLMQLGDHLTTHVGSGQLRLKLEDFGALPGSFHPLMRRQLTPFFLKYPAQDVFHALEAIAMLGNDAPQVDEARYQLNLGADSFTASAGFSHRIDRSYRQMIQFVRSGQTQVPHRQQLRVIRALQKRRQWNQRFIRDGDKFASFYHFLADALA